MADQKDFKKRLKALMLRPENQVCSDCPERQPRWASLIVQGNGGLAMGAFCCLECSGSHRRLGVHISFVRSINLDSWKEKEVLAMENGGNAKVNAFFEAHLPPGVKPSNLADGPTRERFIRDKYERRKYFDGNIDIANIGSGAPPATSSSVRNNNNASGPAAQPAVNLAPPSEVAQRRLQNRQAVMAAAATAAQKQPQRPGMQRSMSNVSNESGDGNGGKRHDGGGALRRTKSGRASNKTGGGGGGAIAPAPASAPVDLLDFGSLTMDATTPTTAAAVPSAGGADAFDAFGGNGHVSAPTSDGQQQQQSRVSPPHRSHSAAEASKLPSANDDPFEAFRAPAVGQDSSAAAPPPVKKNYADIMGLYNNVQNQPHQSFNNAQFGGARGMAPMMNPQHMQQMTTQMSNMSTGMMLPQQQQQMYQQRMMQQHRQMTPQQQQQQMMIMQQQQRMMNHNNGSGGGGGGGGFNMSGNMMPQQQHQHSQQKPAPPPASQKKEDPFAQFGMNVFRS